MSTVELEKVRLLWQEFLTSLAPPAGIGEWRAGFDEALAPFSIPAGASVEDVEAGGVPALLVTAAGASRDRTVIWSHSGGYVMGSARGYRFFGAGLSAVADASVLLLDYRLAPEHPYPAALDDAKAAYRWLLACGTEPANIVLGGDSAGGGLTAATALALLDEGLPMPAGVVLVSPWTDLTLSGESLRTRADRDPVASDPVLAGMREMYAGSAPPASRYLSPALADLTGLPPLLVLVGSEEVLHDDAARIVTGARAAGGEAELVVGEGQFHIWPLFHQMLSEGQEALGSIGAFVRTRTAASRA
jgi:monoterpene epsilon-lactone hydrolase